MKLAILFAGLVFFSMMGLPGHGAEATTNASDSESKNEPFFPLMGWCLKYDDIEEYAECGFTVTLANLSESDLDICKKLGLKAILRDPQLDEVFFHWNDGDRKKLEADLRTIAKKYGTHPAVYGYVIADEPCVERFTGLAKAVAILKEETPEKLTYTYMFPNFATTKQMGASTYLEYLAKYFEIVKPRNFLYDSYINMWPGRKKLWYANLEIVRDLTIEKDIPFWIAVLTTGHWYFPVPSEGEVSLEVFAALAYGCRGICYFTYHTPASEDFRLGPIDQFGKRTPMWDIVRRCNFQVRALAPILLKLRSTGVYYSTLNSDFDEFEHLPGNLVESIDSTDPKNANLLIGEFVHQDGSKWFMLVNLDTERGAHFGKLEFNGQKIQSVNNYTGKMDATLDRGVGPGQGKLYRVE